MRVLLISPSFFGYEHTIADAFRARGHRVDVLDERPSNTPLERAAVRVAPRLRARRIRAHYAAAEADLVVNAYDLVLVIKGEVVTESFLRSLRRTSPAARFLFYAYDSFANSPAGVRKLALFDQVYSFDPADATGTDAVILKHLFYDPVFHPSDRPRDIDISFVGTLHGDRHAFAHAVAAAVPPERRFLFFYTPAAWFFWIRKLLLRGYRRIPAADVRSAPLPRTAVADLMRRSKVVIDLQRDGQSGLTMRTFEALASGAGLITANATIMETAFYDPRRMLVVPADLALIDPQQIAAFVAQQPDVGAAPAGIEEHSAAAWVAGFLVDAQASR